MSPDLVGLAWVVPALPLFGAAVLLVFGRRLGQPGAGVLATGLMGAAFAFAVLLLLALVSLPAEERRVTVDLFSWIDAGAFSARLSFLVDPLSVTMILFVTGVGALIHLYSIGYMHGDPRFPRFFAYLNLFATAMLVLVLGGNLLVTFLGWEGVGLCSYLLISFWFERPSAAVAGKKAFVTNRVGDFGFLLAIFLVVAHLGSLEYREVLPAASGLAPGVATAIALLLFLAAAGKSAQGPLFVWLPDAMEGPTPVSALIHAATMVTAGVYLVARAHPFFERSAVASDVVAWVGAATALVAATVALVHTDIKRVLAYSTISQLGYMFLAVGVGAYVAAIFHMVTHAFFKALLFLGAGSVMHGLHDEQDMRRMGGLRRLMPVTAGTFIVAWLAIAGIVPFAGFWSKDEILAAAFVRGRYALWAVGVLGALLTAFYMTRQVRLVFYGDARFDHAGAARPHESPRTMTFPLRVLALLTVAGGLLNLPFRSFEHLGRFLEPVFSDVPASAHVSSFAMGLRLSVVAVAAGAAGILAGRSLYGRGLVGIDPVERGLGRAAPVLREAYGLDRAYAALVSRPGRRLYELLAGPVDQRGIDGVVNGLAAAVRGGGRIIRRAQTGFVRSYALGILAGATLLVVVMVTRASR